MGADVASATAGLEETLGNGSGLDPSANSAGVRRFLELLRVFGSFNEV